MSLIKLSLRGLTKYSLSDRVESQSIAQKTHLSSPKSFLVLAMTPSKVVGIRPSSFGSPSSYVSAMVVVVRRVPAYLSYYRSRLCYKECISTDTPSQQVLEFWVAKFENATADRPIDRVVFDVEFMFVYNLIDRSAEGYQETNDAIK